MTTSRCETFGRIIKSIKNAFGTVPLITYEAITIKSIHKSQELCLKRQELSARQVDLSRYKTDVNVCTY